MDLTEILPISEIGFLKILLIILIGIFLGVLAKFIINRIAKMVIYPWVRKSSPSSYKSTITGVSLIANITQWLIILFFILQSSLMLNIQILDEISAISVTFIPKLVVGFLILVIGLILSSVLTKKIETLEFKNSKLFAKTFQMIFVSATILSFLEAIDIKVTPFLIIFKVFLYTLGIMIAIALGLGLGIALKPEIVKFVKELQKRD